jgi:translation initiation factor 5B
LNSRHAKILAERFSHRLNEEEKQVFDRIITMKRKSDPAYGYL